jgi:hypothetical protein
LSFHILRENDAGVSKTNSTRNQQDAGQTCESSAIVRHGSPGRKVFLLAKYRRRDQSAVRKREATVNICMVSDSAVLRGLSCHAEDARFVSNKTGVANPIIRIADFR